LTGSFFALACNKSADTAPAAVESIAISSNVSANGAFVGDQVQLDATPLDLDGNTVSATISYASSDKTVATVTASGLVSAVGAGSSDIAVTAGGQVAHFPFTIDWSARRVS
jgi:hypothetical protein